MINATRYFKTFRGASNLLIHNLYGKELLAKPIVRTLFCSLKRKQVVRKKIFGKADMPPPERWEEYSPMGKVIPGTRFIAFKVPLKETLLRTVEEKDKFSPAILVAKLGEQGLTLAGVIDLTYTWKYYNKEEFLTRSVLHKKVFTKGHEVPTDSVYKEFSDAVESLDENDKLIGVHCTHGVNRTGYLICRYMIEELKVDPQEAIDLFNHARGHDLERENYILDLKGRKSVEPVSALCQTSRNEKSSKSKKEKPRWRHNREDHPGWREKCRPHSSGASAPYPLPSSMRNSRRLSRDSDKFNQDYSMSKGHCGPTSNNSFQNYNFQHNGWSGEYSNCCFDQRAMAYPVCSGRQAGPWQNPRFCPDSRTNPDDYDHPFQNMGGYIGHHWEDNAHDYGHRGRRPWRNGYRGIDRRYRRY
ncbi:RNA/rnp complex-1-interacting phosphatase [Plakobranchus ocellatus]|uniref:RNA/rnp complex-1-interacting phosphatase n=1 Tax=Plakobranchus ocellatus TaxID=259542 RepID=A0AAV3Z7V0_9GAST|nr:RNA/rnp complex-1-interacting phosphatase [Plakobranchus ocellatus]